MKAVKFLLKKPEVPKKAELVICIVVSLLSAAAASYMTAFFDLGIPAAAVVGVLMVLIQVRFKAYKLFYTPLAYHLICIGISIAAANWFLGFVEAGGYKKTVVYAAALLMLLYFFEFVFGVISMVCSDGAHPENFPKAIVVVFSLLFTVFVYLPSETYFNNFQDFTYCYFDFVPHFAVLTILLTLGASLALSTFKQKVFRFVMNLSCGLLLGVYCQYIFMNGDLPSAMGTAVDWDSLKTKSIINGVIWVLLIALPFVASAVVNKIRALDKSAVAKNSSVALSAFVGGIQLISFVVMLITTKASFFSANQYRLSGEEQFVLSSNKNVFTLIIDMADKSFFEKAYLSDPSSFDCLKDFTSYTNTCMMYDSTFLSIPQMLSGTEELPEGNLDGWLEKTWSSDPCEAFYSRLHENNYKVNVFGNFAFSYRPFKDKLDNCVLVENEDVVIKKKLLYRRINSMSAFRYLPLGLKQYSEPDHLVGNDAVMIPNSCIMSNSDYLNAMDFKLSEDDRNYFIVEHIEGTHGFSGRISVETQQCVKIINRFIDELKRLGKYDDSVIIITGDHGDHAAYYNIPIWYIKQAGEQHDELQLSNAPIYHSDFPATCLDAAGLTEEGDEQLIGRSIFDIGEDEQGERLVFQRINYNFVETGNQDDIPKNSYFGYYYTGTVEDLVEHEKNDPPDLVLEFGSGT